MPFRRNPLADLVAGYAIAKCSDAPDKFMTDDQAGSNGRLGPVIPFVDVQIDQGYEVMKDAVMEVVGQHFRPEFINRVDELVVFHPLNREQIRLIAGIQLERLRERLQQSGLDIELSEAAMDRSCTCQLLSLTFS